MIKDETVNNLIGDEYIEDPVERENKLAPLIDLAIEDAAGEINGYLNKRYPTPLPSPPKVINKLAKDISIYNLHSRIGIDADSEQNIIITRYKNTVKYLENVAKGLIDIGVQEIGSKARTGFQINSNDRIFSRDSMKGM